MYEFEKELQALANCPIIYQEEMGGSMKYNPFPIISASNNLILSHEICHVLAGRKDYGLYETSVIARDKDEMYRWILNFLYDWYDELNHSFESGFLRKRIELLKSEPFKFKCAVPPIVNQLCDLYSKNIPIPGMPTINSKMDLIVYADELCDIIDKQIKSNLGIFGRFKDLVKSGNVFKIFGIILDIEGNKIGNGKNKIGNGKLKGKVSIEGIANKYGASPGMDLGIMPKHSDYYMNTVGRYYNIIKSLSELWKKNKYDWKNFYFGEINWKNLVGMFIGEKLSLPVFRLFLKLYISRSVYLVIDRSGSTNDIKNIIMDTAIIIAESLRMNNIPISILDVGVADKMVNKIDEDLDLSWFTPMSNGGTALGEVCSQIKDADHNSYLLIITDGQPNNFETLLDVLNKFPGNHLSFVIGDSFRDYYENTNGRAVQVEPNTIIREMQNEQFLY